MCVYPCEHSCVEHASLLQSLISRVDPQLAPRSKHSNAYGGMQTRVRASSERIKVDSIFAPPTSALYCDPVNVTLHSGTPAGRGSEAVV